MLRRNIFKRKPRKNQEKKKKRKLFERGGAFCQGFLKKVFAYIFYAKNLFFKNPQGLTFTELSGWIQEAP